MSRARSLFLCLVALATAQGIWIDAASGQLGQVVSSGRSARSAESRLTAVERSIGDRDARPLFTSKPLAAGAGVIAAAPASRLEMDAVITETIAYDGAPYTGIGMSGGGTFFTAVRFTTQRNCTLKALTVYQASGQQVSAPGYCYLWANNGGRPGSVLESLPYANAPGLWTYKLLTPQYLAAGTDFFLGARWTHVNGQNPVGADAGPVVPGREFIGAGSPPVWSVTPFSYNWNCRAIVASLIADPDMTCLSVDGVDSPERPDQWLTLKATVRNVGITPRDAGSVPVKLRIDGPLGYTYSDVDQFNTGMLVAGASEQVVFQPNWRIPSTPGIYSISAFTDFPGDVNQANDTARFVLEVSNWISYADWSAPYWFASSPEECGVFFHPVEFGLSYPLSVESLKTMFYITAGQRDSSFNFKIYTGDGATRLFMSPSVKAGAYYPSAVRHALPTALPIAGGDFLVTVAPGPDSHPDILADAVFQQSSVVGDSTQWSWWTNGEFYIAAFVSWTAPANDIGIHRVRIPWVRVEPGVPLSPVGVARNYGLSAATNVPALCHVLDTLGRIIYNGSGMVTVAPGDTAPVTFSPAWTPPSGTRVYRVNMETNLSGDGNRGNDTVRDRFFGFPAFAQLVAPSKLYAVTLDGDIQLGEWSDAPRYDISNLYGWNDLRNRYPPGSAFLSVKHDDGYLYLAYDLPYFSSSDSIRIGVYCDENYDGAWALDSSEGSYRVLHRNRAVPVDTVLYQALPSVWQTMANGAFHRTMFSNGRMQAEVQLPIGSAKKSLNVSPAGDTMGFATFVEGELFEDWAGYWKTDMDPLRLAEPSFYGALIISGQVFTAPDAACENIMAPSGSQDTSATILPVAVLRNAGLSPATFNAAFEIRQADSVVYRSTATVTLDPGSVDTHAFGEWLKPHAPGPYWSRCTVNCFGDTTPNNDQKSSSFSIYAGSPDSGWKALADVPLGLKEKKVKDGGCMACVRAGDTGFVYLLKGASSYEYYRFSSATMAWQERESIPAIGSLGKKKKVKKGACMTEADGRIYAGKGGGTPEWWEYDPARSGSATYPWTQKTDIPSGVKTVREGTGAASVQVGDTIYIYFLRGSGGREFLRYNTLSNTWATLTSAPEGLSGKPYKNGSCVAADPTRGHVYLLKGGYNEFYRYSIDSNSWRTLTPLPLTGSSGKKRKARGGSSLTFSLDRVYCLKGGTYQFWSYQRDSGTWAQHEDAPKGEKNKSFKGGAGIVWAVMPGRFYATKGNASVEFYQYAPITGLLGQPGSLKSGQMGSGAGLIGTTDLAAFPSPWSGVLEVSYALPQDDNVSLKLLDVCGRSRAVLVHGLVRAGRHAVVLAAQDLAPGIYILRLATGNRVLTRKLIRQ